MPSVFAALMAGFLGLLAWTNVAAQKHPLTDHHKQWLEKDVVYIISDPERKVFLELADDDIRDQFVETFWRHRDPTPGTSDNEFKEEHYRRISYANMWFGSRRYEDGWKSDRGRIYILFGDPMDRQKWSGQNDIRDCELWFYQAQGRVPETPFFRLLFYQKDFAHDYVLYNPNIDGPQELVMQIAPTRSQALYILRERFGDELWQAAQSSIPTDTAWGTFSSQTEALMAKIDNVKNTSVDSSWAETFALTNGRVTAKISFRPTKVSLLSRVLYNLNCQAFLHLGMQIQPEDLQIGEIDGRYYAIYNVRTFIEDSASKKEVLVSENHWETEFQTKEGRVLPRPVGFTHVMPLVPGRYRIFWILENEVSQTFSFHEMAVEVPGPSSEQPFLTDPLLTARYDRLDREGARAIHPFRIFNLQYVPDLAGAYNVGDNFSVFFEYLYPVKEGKAEIGKVDIQIALNPVDPAVPAPPPISHVIPEDQLTGDGVRLIHRQIPLKDLPPGDYAITLTAKEARNGKTATASAKFSHLGQNVLVRPRLDAIAIGPAKISVDYLLERARQFELTKRVNEAISELELALEKNPQEESLKKRLEYLRARRNE